MYHERYAIMDVPMVFGSHRYDNMRGCLLVTSIQYKCNYGDCCIEMLPFQIIPAHNELILSIFDANKLMCNTQ